MPAPPTVAILFHELVTQEEIQNYRAFRCAEHWKEWGIRVRILCGTEDPPNADLLIPQVNLSVMPDAYRDYLDGHPKVINRSLYDVRKVAFSQNLVTKGDSYDGPVVVKTNSNFGGLPEHRLMIRSPLSRRLPYQLRQLARRVFKKWVRGSHKLAYTDFMEPRNYMVFESKQELPDSVFDNQSLVVERFRFEQHEGLYVSRNYAFLGSAGITVWEKSKKRLIRGDSAMQLEIIPPNEKVLAVRKSLGMDYGKLDYAMEGDEVVLYDVNPTPCSNFQVYPQIKNKIIEEMSKGIFDWFPDFRPGREGKD